jgi:8-oxo-dGTP pyrophosphatase MutT (NUDIX family)
VIPFDSALRASIVANLAAHERREHELDGRRHAAVAILLVDSRPGDDHTDPAELPDSWFDGVPGVDAVTDVLDGRMVGVSGGAAFVLCRRPSRLRAHPGQWALPGGRLDPGESAIEAAQRETWEELGVDAANVEVLGLLDDYPTRSGFVITPVVLWARADLELHPNAAEVAHAYRIGLAELCRDDSPRFVAIPESDRPVVQVPLGRDLIHAPTGAVLLQFRCVALDGHPGTRVDELEQPVFAWR